MQTSDGGVPSGTPETRGGEISLTEKIELTVPAGILAFLETHKAYMTAREGHENMTGLFEMFITQGFDAMVDDWQLKTEEVHAQYNIPN
jgi:hypothetical protein